LPRRFAVTRSSITILVLAAGLLAACGGGQREEAAETPADTVAAAPSISLADIEGTWNMRYVPVSGDTTATTSQVRVTPEGWTLLLPDRDPITATVTAAGDSLIVVEGPYESIRRAGTTVTISSVYRLAGDRLVGVVAARYGAGGADDMLVMLSEGTRAP
jgi:hypothetical protein